MFEDACGGILIGEVHGLRLEVGRWDAGTQAERDEGKAPESKPTRIGVSLIGMSLIGESWLETWSEMCRHRARLPDPLSRNINTTDRSLQVA